MAITGAAHVLQALEDEGIRFAFGIPGTHNIELYDLLATSKSVRPILVTDEQSASFMADAAWRASGIMACVNVVPGAGLTHAMSGIAEAFLDGIPMLVLGCGIRRDTGKAYQLHDVDQQALAAPVTKGAFRPERGEEIYGTIRKACRLAREGCPGPVFVEIPANLYILRQPESTPWQDEKPIIQPISQDVLKQCAEVLAKAKRPLIYVGLGAARAGADLVALAEKLEAPVSSTFQGKGVFPESHPLFLWPGFGAAAPSFVRGMAGECDATLAIGCRFGEVATGSYGMTPPSPLIHVDIDPSVPGRNFPADIAVACDAAEFVRALLPLLSGRAKSDDLRNQIRAGRAEAAAEIQSPSETGVSPGRLLKSLQEIFGPETIFTSDSGNGTFLAIEGLILDKPGQLLGPMDYSCMGYSVPAAIGAKLARPDVPVVALAGDGAFLMTGLEMLTAASLGVAAAFLVLRDRELAQIAQFQGIAYNRKTCSELPDYDLAAISAGTGVEFLQLKTDEAIASVLEQAKSILSEGRPVAIDVAIDYSRKTFFTKGVVWTTLGRLPWMDRLRFVGRAVGRKIFE